MAPEALNKALFSKLSAATATATGSASCVRRAMALAEAPSFDRGELTEKGSLNQRALRDHNADMIMQLYQSNDGVFKV